MFKNNVLFVALSLCIFSAQSQEKDLIESAKVSKEDILFQARTAGALATLIKKCDLSVSDKSKVALKDYQETILSLALVNKIPQAEIEVTVDESKKLIADRWETSPFPQICPSVEQRVSDITTKYELFQKKLND